ncbi:MAG TPA: response regulator [Polyangium sp.]|nr:response regulator [Polyangium sp.]
MTGARRISCVEDNLADFGLLKEAFLDLELEHHLDHVVDGECALAYLLRQGKYAATPIPDLVLLDLNLPRKSGFEVLQELSKDPALQRLPIVILTTTARELDVKRAAGDLQIHFITKPMDFDAFLDVVRHIDAIVRGVPRQAP